MTTQLLKARRGEISPEMVQVAETEGLEPEKIMELVASGEVVIPANRNHSFKARGIGKGLRTKVNANIGSSPKRARIDEELQKLKVAVDAGADAVMDLSTGGDIDKIRKAVIEASPLMVGTVPVYQAAKGTTFTEIDGEDIFAAIRSHARSGVDFVTVHCGVTRDLLPFILDPGERVMGIVSRGGGASHRLDAETWQGESALRDVRSAP